MDGMPSLATVFQGCSRGANQTDRASAWLGRGGRYCTGPASDNLQMRFDGVSTSNGFQPAGPGTGCIPANFGRGDRI